MSQLPRAIELIDDAVNDALAHGVVQLGVQDERLDGRTIRVDGRQLLQFASCSYLGLELDPRLRQGAIDAVERYGTQFSCSRAYLSAPAYEELEALLGSIFEAPVLVAPSTTLGHLSALPVLVEADDAVLLDHQVHQSVQLATAQLRLQGNTVDLVRHGDVGLLEEKVRQLSATHRRVWYLGDGIYSMYGEFAPAKALSWLLSRYEQLHLYLDDAHGMSWTGRHGRGFAAESFGRHERVVIAVSLNKSFAAAGGALVFPDAELHRKVRNCGPTLMFGGPIQPPMLGAAVASARIHLSPEIQKLQAELSGLIAFANRTAAELDLPLVSRAEIPIRYLGTGVRAAAYNLTARLKERGIYMSPSAFPAVGSRRAGVRFAITRHHTEADLRGVLEAVAEELPASLARGGLTRKEVDRAFGLDTPRRAKPAAVPTTSLSLRHEQSIRDLDAEEWDACLAGRGVFDSATLELLEAIFGAHQAAHSRWAFHYFVARDQTGRVVLATFFTEALWKDDLLAKAEVSEEVERRRCDDPYFLTSRTLSMGSLLTEGDHLFLDRNADWRSALRLLFAALEEIREECEAPTVVIRDLPAGDEELARFLGDSDFLSLPAPESWNVALDWAGEDQYLAILSRRARRFHRRLVIPMEEVWEQEILGPDRVELGEQECAHLHRLYRNVQERHLSLNTFPLPPELLPGMLRTPGWELLQLRLRLGHGGRSDGRCQGFALCHAGAGRYDWLMVGMDYEYAESHALYPQLVSRVVKRAAKLGLKRIGLGLGSGAMKQRFGADREERVMYVQSIDRFQQDLLDLVASDLKQR